MSDVSQGPGWWQASDGKWYSPEQASASAAAAPPPPGQGWVPAPAEQPKKPVYKRVWFWLLVIVVLGAGGCTAVLAVAGNAVDKANTAKHTVIYSVTGDGVVNITYATYTNGSTGTEQVANQQTPWSKTFVASGLFNAYNVGAEIASGNSATCSISIDGKVVVSKTSTGQYSNVDCSAVAS
jgi:hypothetical protein